MKPPDVKVVYPTQHRPGAPDPPTVTRGADVTLRTIVVRRDVERISDPLLAARNALLRPLRRKLDARTRADIRAALEHLNLACGALRASPAPHQETP
jgi:hypothetical protein